MPTDPGNTSSPGEVLWHPLDGADGVLGGPASAPGGGDVVLEGVDQLVPQDVIRLRIGRRQGHDHAVPHALRHAARSLGKEPGNRVGLLEIRLVGVDQNRLLLLERIAEGPGESLVPPLGHPTEVTHDPLSLPFVEVDVEVGRVEDAEVEIVALDLVAAEVLTGPGNREGQKAEDKG